MISEEKIKMFSYYRGDNDAWARAAQRHRNVMSDNDWYLINSLVQDVALVKKGLASKEYSNRLEEKLISNCDSIETIEKLKILTGNNNSFPKEGFWSRIGSLFKKKS